MEEKAPGSSRSTRIHSEGLQGSEPEESSNATSNPYLHMVARLEELLGAVTWLRTDQARMGAYTHQKEVTALLNSLEELLQTMEELTGRHRNPPGNWDSSPGSPAGPERQLGRLMAEVDRSIQALIADRVVIRGEELNRICAVVKRMEQEFREQIRGGRTA